MGILNRAVAGVWSAGQRARAILAQGRTQPHPIAQRIVYIPRGESGVFMSPDEALKISAVWACVMVISDALSASAWDIFEDKAADDGAKQGNRELRNNLNTWWLLNVRPNPEMTAFSFRHASSIKALLWGDAFAEVERNNAGTPVALWPIEPERGWLERDERDRLVLRVHNYTRDDVVLPYRDVLHFKGPSIDGVKGLETFAYAARSWGHAAALEVFGASFFGNGIQASGMITPEGGTLTQEQMEQVVASLKKRHGGAGKSGGLLVLPGGLKLQRFSEQPDQAQFIESRQHMVEEVCRWFGVPPHKIQHLLRATFNNIEEMGIGFVRDCLTPKAEPMAQEVDAKLLPFGNRRLYTRIDLDWLAEGNALSKAQVDARLTGSALRTINEVRKMRGWNTVGPEGDELRAQVQYQPLDAGENRLTEPDPEPEDRERA